METVLQEKPKSTVSKPSPHGVKFEKFLKKTSDSDWLLSARKAAMAHFNKTGFPTVKDEDWRFTNVAPIAKLPFRPVSKLLPTDSEVEAALSAQVFAQFKGARLVFINGHYSAALSSVTSLPDGVIVCSLAEALAKGIPSIEKQLFHLVGADNNAFAALNTAFFQDGTFIHVPAGKVVEEPIQALYITTAEKNGSTTHPRNLIFAEANSQMTFLESYLTLTNATHFTNAVTELWAGDNAHVEHVKFQDESLQAFHMATLYSHLGRASQVQIHSIDTGAKLSRNNINTCLNGEGLECLLNGLYLTKGDQLADHHMIVDHAQPHCDSHEYFNGILADRSKGVFHGRILVRPDAQKTDAKQTNKNLLLSDNATADTKPQLEIYADDVKCTHGATIGQLNEESIFYCRSRGIGRETARRMLIHAFAGEIIERIRHEGTREVMNKLIWDRLEEHPLVAEVQEGEDQNSKLNA